MNDECNDMIVKMTTWDVYDISQRVHKIYSTCKENDIAS